MFKLEELIEIHDDAEKIIKNRAKGLLEDPSDYFAIPILYQQIRRLCWAEYMLKTEYHYYFGLSSIPPDYLTIPEKYHMTYEY